MQYVTLFWNGVMAVGRAPIELFRRPIGWLLLAYWLMLFAATHVPLPEMPDMPAHSDKGFHLVVNAGLGLLLSLWLSARRDLGLRELTLILGFLILYGGLDELLQIPVGRHADIFDALSNATGSAIGVFTFVVARRLLPRFWMTEARPQLD